MQSASAGAWMTMAHHADFRATALSTLTTDPRPLLSTLPNGLTLLAVPMPHLASASVAASRARRGRAGELAGCFMGSGILNV